MLEFVFTGLLLLAVLLGAVACSFGVYHLFRGHS